MTTLVLDTNVYSFCPETKLAELAKRGLQIAVSELAFTEALAKSVREYRAGAPKERARGRFFMRAKRVAGYVNGASPIALGMGGITRRIAAETRGLPPDKQAEERASLLNRMWRAAVESEYPDDVWLECGQDAEEWLAWRDDTLRLVVRTMREQPVPRSWENMTTEERLTATQESLAVFWGFNAAMTERFNAHIATVAFRFIEGAEGERPPRENDGADVHLTQHLGEGSVLVTGDARLIALVDRSGTYQAPWVRSLGELDELPDGPPWGESAREHARAFKRK